MAERCNTIKNLTLGYINTVYWPVIVVVLLVCYYYFLLSLLHARVPYVGICSAAICVCLCWYVSGLEYSIATNGQLLQLLANYFSD